MMSNCWCSAKRHCSGFAAKADLLHVDLWKEPRQSLGMALMAGSRCSTARIRRSSTLGYAGAFTPSVRSVPSPSWPSSEEKLGRSWKRYPFDQELADSEMRLILERLTPETATAG